MDNGVAKTCKISSVIIFILTLLGGIVLGKILALSGFNLAAMVSCWLGGFTLCLLLYSAGEIITRLDQTNTRLYEMNHVRAAEHRMQHAEIKMPVMQYVPVPAASVKRTPDGKWICKNCNTKNEVHASFCKDCGTYR